MSLFEWWKNQFLPNASDLTLAILFILYDKYYGDRKLSDEEMEYIKDELKILKSLKYKGDQQ